MSSVVPPALRAYSMAWTLSAFSCRSHSLAAGVQIAISSKYIRKYIRPTVHRSWSRSSRGSSRTIQRPVILKHGSSRRVGRWLWLLAITADIGYYDWCWRVVCNFKLISAIHFVIRAPSTQFVSRYSIYRPVTSCGLIVNFQLVLWYTPIVFCKLNWLFNLERGFVSKINTVVAVIVSDIVLIV